MIYRAVIFDAGGVLHTDLTQQVLNDVSRELSLSSAQAADFWKMVVAELGTGRTSEAQFWANATKQFGIRAVRPEENLLGRTYAKLLLPRWQILSLARELSSTGVKTAVLSNTIEPHVRANQAAGLFDCFDETFLSNELHLRKPDPQIFEVALARLGVKPEQTIFIDDQSSNLETPRRLGIRSIHYSIANDLIQELKALALPVNLGGIWGSFTLLVRKDGAILAQHRDNKPNINEPGGITGFGGSGEPGETPFDCALRELSEETNLRPKPSHLSFFRHYLKTKDVHGEDSNIWAFVLNNVDDKKLQIFEGQGYVVLKDINQTKSMPLSVLLREVVSQYWQQ